MRALRVSRATVLFVWLCAAAQEAGSSGPDVSITASNQFQFGRGDALSEPGVDAEPTPLDYLMNTTEFRLGVGAFFLAGRFNLDEPSRWATSSSHVAEYREYFSRRTLGFTSDHIDISVGHFLTGFGRGLSLNLREDRLLDTANILDGALLRTRLPFLDLQALAGRPSHSSSSAVAGLAPAAGSAYQKLVLGAYADVYPFFKADRLSALSGASIGLGLVNYRDSIGPQLLVPLIDSIVVTVIDSVTTLYDTITSGVPSQDRTELYVPTFALNLPTPWVDLYIEHARLYTKAYWYDSLQYLPFEFEQKPSFATYASLGATHFGFSLLAEYKDYRLGHNQDYTMRNGVRTMVYYVDPPAARYRHSWSLLTRHEPANLVEDVRGYATVLTWSHLDNTTIAAAYSTGGPHREASVFAFDLERGYWDVYLEWNQTFGSMVQLKVGLDMAKMDPLYNRDRNYLGAAKVSIGPFASRRTVTVHAELERKSREFDVVDPVLYVKTGTEKVRTTNAVVALGYSISPWASAALTWEHAELPDALSLPNRTDDYFSAGVTVKPSPKHTLVVEYGSFGGGMKCTYGNCFTLPPYQGLRITLTNVL